MKFKSLIRTFCDRNQIVTPWEVKGKVDYSKLIQQFGTEAIDDKLVTKFENVTGTKVHPWIKRGIFFTHRGLNTILDAHSKGEPIFLYTGRGPTSKAMHIGHLIPFLLTKWLQDTLNCPLIIQLSDEEKYYFKKDVYSFDEIYHLGHENAKEIIACGFDPKRTFIFSNRDYRLRCKEFELLATEMKKQTNLKDIKKIFGFDDEANVGMVDWPFYQTAAAYSSSYPHIFKTSAYCLIPHAIDQDPYFRLARDLSSKMGLYKPCSIQSRFVPPLNGDMGKMSSSSGQQFSVFLNDDTKTIRNKILKYSFSAGGGDGSLADHRKYGGDPDKDIAFQYLKYFEMDDDKLNQYELAFRKGELTCGELKMILIDKITSMILSIQEKKNQIDNNTMEDFFSLKDIQGEKDNKDDIFPEESLLYSYLSNLGISYMTDYDKMKPKANWTKVHILKGQNDTYYFYITRQSKVIDLNEIKKCLSIKRLVHAEKDTVDLMFTKDNTSKVSLSLFSLLKFNKNHNLIVIIDKEIKHNTKIGAAPLRNDIVTYIDFSDLTKFVSSLNIKWFDI